MSRLQTFLIATLLAFSLPIYAALPAPGEPGAPKDKRYCGEPTREADGTITRSPKVLRDFKKVFPCPTTLLSDGPCPRFQINHTIPRASGGCDTGENLTWLPVDAKTCKFWWCIDRWERKYHAIPRQPVIPTP